MRVNAKSRINAPEALLFKENIVVLLSNLKNKILNDNYIFILQVMSFIGLDGMAAPQLKEVPSSLYSAEKWKGYYISTLAICHALYHKCKLVHGDLSEYNLLLHEDKVFVIDFGQAVDISHPSHLDFLGRDIRTLSAFFRRKDVSVIDPEVALQLVLMDLPAFFDETFNLNSNPDSEVCSEPVSVEFKERLVASIIELEL